jgi:hypothetical protein
LLGNEGIYIVGGKHKEEHKEEKWLPYIYFYDLIKGEMSRVKVTDASKNEAVVKALFGPSMSKPIKLNGNHV